MTQNNNPPRATFTFPLGALCLATTLVLFVLKATAFPKLDWWLVLAPAIIGVGIPIALFLLVATFALGVLLIVPAVDRRHKRQMLRRRNALYKGKKP